MHIGLELSKAEDGRVEGSVTCDSGGGRVTFSGWLELLRLLEAAVPADGGRAGLQPEPPGRPSQEVRSG